jgi:hypothetical protein
MEQPIVRAPDRDAAMPARMSGQRHQQHFVVRSGIARTAEKPNQDSPSSSTGAHFLTAAICTAR